MKKPAIRTALSIFSALLLAACFHSGTQPPPGYCHRLKTAINNPANTQPNNVGPPPQNPSVMLQQYQDLGCEAP